MIEQSIDLPIDDSKNLETWRTILACSHISLAVGGFTNTWSVFQKYYEITYSQHTSSTIAWVGSLQYCFFFLPGAFMGWLVDSGQHRMTFYVATVCYPASLFIVAQLSTFWAILLIQGFMLAISGGILMGTAMSLAAKMLPDRRALLIGIVTASSSIGGVTFPILFSNCLVRVGFAWTLRICGCMMVFAVLIVISTLPHRQVIVRSLGDPVDYEAFRRCSYNCYVLGAFLVGLGIYTPMSFLSVTSIESSLDPTYIVSITNAASLFGRLLPVTISDRFGSMNLLLLGLLGSSISAFVWPVCSVAAAIVVFGIFNGFFQGVFASLYVAGAAEMGQSHNAGRRVGVVSTAFGVGILGGLPISGLILQQEGLPRLSYYAGAIVLAGACSVFGSRYCALCGLRGKI